MISNIFKLTLLFLILFLCSCCCDWDKCIEYTFPEAFQSWVSAEGCLKETCMPPEGNTRFRFQLTVGTIPTGMGTPFWADVKCDLEPADENFPNGSVSVVDEGTRIENMTNGSTKAAYCEVRAGSSPDKYRIKIEILPYGGGGVAFPPIDFIFEVPEQEENCR